MSTVKARQSKKAAKDTSVTNGVPSTSEIADVLTLSEAADYLRVGEKDVVEMVKTQGLAARQIGKDWRFLKSALQNWLGGEPKRSSKQALLNLAGKFRDDPYLEEITREAYQRRGRPISEEGE